MEIYALFKYKVGGLAKGPFIQLQTIRCMGK